MMCPKESSLSWAPRLAVFPNEASSSLLSPVSPGERKQPCCLDGLTPGTREPAHLTDNWCASRKAGRHRGRRSAGSPRKGRQAAAVRVVAGDAGLHIQPWCAKPSWLDSQQLLWHPSHGRLHTCGRAEGVARDTPADQALLT